MNGHVDTPYGPLPGCPEHGVTPTIYDPDFYRCIVKGDA
jgi:hypothetical protein